MDYWLNYASLHHPLLLWVVYAAIVITVLELLWLVRQRARWPMAVNVLAGLSLMLGLRSALLGQAAWLVVVWLSVSGVAHLAYWRMAWVSEAPEAPEMSEPPSSQKAQRQPG